MSKNEWGTMSRTEQKNNWNSKMYTRIYINVKRDTAYGKSSEKEALQRMAKEEGKSTSRYIIDAINAYAGKEVLTALEDDSRKRKKAKDQE